MGGSSRANVENSGYKTLDPANATQYSSAGTPEEQAAAAYNAWNPVALTGQAPAAVSANPGNTQANINAYLSGASNPVISYNPQHQRDLAIARSAAQIKGRDHFLNAVDAERVANESVPAENADTTAVPATTNPYNVGITAGDTALTPEEFNANLDTIRTETGWADYDPTRDVFAGSEYEDAYINNAAAQEAADTIYNNMLAQKTFGETVHDPNNWLLNNTLIGQGVQAIVPEPEDDRDTSSSLFTGHATAANQDYFDSVNQGSNWNNNDDDDTPSHAEIMESHGYTNTGSGWSKSDETSGSWGNAGSSNTSSGGWTPPGFSWNDGTMGVPEIDFGPDPLMLADGTEYASKPVFINGQWFAPIAKTQVEEDLDPYEKAQRAFEESIANTDFGSGGDPSLSGMFRNAAKNAVFSAFNPFNNGGFIPGVTHHQMPEGHWMPGATHMADGGYAGWQQHAQGVDSVPAMLTPGEAVIPAPAAQDPANKPHIEAMINQGRDMNNGVPAEAPSEMEAVAISGPLSGKAKREQLKLIQDLSLKKKSWLADEQRKQELHQQKLKDMKMKGALAAKQSME